MDKIFQSGADSCILQNENLLDLLSLLVYSFCKSFKFFGFNDFDVTLSDHALILVNIQSYFLSPRYR